MSRRAGAFVLILAGVARADSPLVRGTEAFHARHYRDAAAAFRAAPTDPEATYRLGVALVAAGDVPGAVDAWERVLLLDPAHARARRNLELFRTVDDDATRIARARALVARGRAASAVALLEGVASPEAALVRLEARALAGEPAGDDAALALAVAPASARPLRALADGAALAGDDARARRLYELYIGRFGGEPDARAVRRWLEHPRRSPPDHDRSSGDAEPPPAPGAPP